MQAILLKNSWIHRFVDDSILTFSRGNSVWGAHGFSSEEKYERTLLLTIIPLLQDLTSLGGRFKDMWFRV